MGLASIESGRVQTLRVRTAIQMKAVWSKCVTDGLGPTEQGRGAGHRGTRAESQMRLRVLVAVLMALFSYLFFSHCIISTVEVQGLSMYPTLHDGDRLLLDRFSYWHRVPQRGDLVVVRDPEHGEYAVKRIIALPGEQVQMQRNIAYINGHRLVEPYLPPFSATEDAMLERPVALAADQYFVMGDNRNNSEDSRHYGPIPRRNIVGVIRLGPQPAAFVRNSPSALVARAAAAPWPSIPVAAKEPPPLSQAPRL